MSSPSNTQRFTGLADAYDDARPSLPEVIPAFLAEVAGVALPACVVDVGSGTGLSARVWLGRSKRIVGVEPDLDMRRKAERASAGEKPLSFVDGTGERLPLPDAAADVVTCVQSLHWMEPLSTLREVARCLRPGGVFAAIDYDWPPFIHWELQQAWTHVREVAETLVQQRALSPGLRHWDKQGHLQRFRDSGHFRHVDEVAFHHRGRGGVAQVLALTRTHGAVGTLLRAQQRDIERPLAELETLATRVLGTQEAPWTYTFRVRFAVR